MSRTIIGAVEMTQHILEMVAALSKRVDALEAESAMLTAATDPDFILAAIADVHDMDATLADYAPAVSRAIRAAMKGPTP